MKQTISSQVTQTKMKTTKISTPASGLTVGLDLGDQWSQFCLLDAAGQIQQASSLWRARARAPRARNRHAFVLGQRVADGIRP